MDYDIENVFTYHSPEGNQACRYRKIRKAGKIMAQIIDEECPDSREKSLAFTNLEQSIMWSNAAIARNE